MGLHEGFHKVHLTKYTQRKKELLYTLPTHLSNRVVCLSDIQRLGQLRWIHWLHSDLYHRLSVKLKTTDYLSVYICEGYIEYSITEIFSSIFT